MNLRVLGVGDNVTDHYLDRGTIHPGGCAYNFAVFAAMRGAGSGYLGILGDDYPAQVLIDTAAQQGIDLSRCRVYHGETARPQVRVTDGLQEFVGGNAGGVWERPLLLNLRDLDYVKGFDLVHSSIFSQIEPNLEALADTGVPLSFDFHDEISEVFLTAHAPKFTFAVLSCRNLTETETVARIEHVHAAGTPHVIATRGEHGAYFSDGDERYFRLAEPAKARDTMGAGDSFLTAFLLSYLAAGVVADPAAPRSARRAAAETALAEASRFAARIVTLDGSSGHAAPYPKDKE